MRRFISYGPAFVVLLSVVVVLFAAPVAVQRIGFANTRAKIVLARQTLADDDILARMNRAIRGIAEAVEPSVVHIDAPSVDMGAHGLSATGSGWVYDSDGHIVTNAHVVENARLINVQFYDGRTVEAKLVGADRVTDVAVLKVPVHEGLFPAHRGTGEPIRQGDRVFAFGSPFGFKFSMSEGIVSGLGRDPRVTIVGDGYTNYIQSDAAVNPGNSGGPLVDVMGHVIGMNVAIATQLDAMDARDTGRSAGISFAIPLYTIESVVSQLIENGAVSRGFLGITYSSGGLATVEDDKGFYTTGVRVEEVTSGMPADAAGVRTGDVITAIDGQRVTSPEVLRARIGSARPGDTISVDLWRDRALRNIDVTLTEFPRDALARNSMPRDLLMLVSERRDRVFIDQISPLSDAYEAGLRRGDAVVAVDGRPVNSVDEFYRALGDSGYLDGEYFGLTVHRLGDPNVPLSVELRVDR